jgi:hypothetical protein
MAIEIVDLPINSMVIVHSFWYVYQRVMEKSQAKSAPEDLFFWVHFGPPRFTPRHYFRFEAFSIHIRCPSAARVLFLVFHWQSLAHIK